jgi:hypothetical protein
VPTSESPSLLFFVRDPVLTYALHSAVVRIQMLAELEEVISYKEATAAGNTERKMVIQKTWMKRFVPASILRVLQLTDYSTDSRDASATSTSGSASSKCEPSSSPPPRTRRCGSSLQTCVASLADWDSPRRLLTRLWAMGTRPDPYVSSPRINSVVRR